ncbi:MAG: sigma-70 family RNA polymerase sigma factor [Betaproteobacteria bacterium]|nr:sigma-70 family RNA polymerase sigma factor [Betaproteobacteria bacterium]
MSAPAGPPQGRAGQETGAAVAANSDHPLPPEGGQGEGWSPAPAGPPQGRASQEAGAAVAANSDHPLPREGGRGEGWSPAPAGPPQGRAGQETGAALAALLADPAGDHSATLERLLPMVYDDLRRLARSYLRRERVDHTLQPTALVNEACLRLLGQDKAVWQNPAQLVGSAAQMMRRVLVNHALARKAAKRDGGQREALLEEGYAPLPIENGVDLAALDAALSELESFDPRQARIVELRFFVGFSIEETAAVLDLSPATIKREWSVARLWLKRRIEEGGN